MLETLSKREFLPVGNLKDRTNFAGIQQMWSKGKSKYVNPGWVEKGDFLISLGYPIGNDFDATAFLAGGIEQLKLS